MTYTKSSSRSLPQCTLLIRRSQNNFSSLPTQVRVIVHLQDVRILAIGVLTSEPTLFVNNNAHSILHPPLLRGMSTPADPLSSHSTSGVRGKPPKPPAAITNEVYFPLVRSLSPSGPSNTNYGLGDGNVLPPHSPPLSSPSLTTGLSRLLPSRRRRNTSTEDTVARDSRLVPTRSRDSDEGRRRSWASVLTRTRSGSIGNTLERTISSSQPIAMTSPVLAVVGEQSPDEGVVETLLEGHDDPDASLHSPGLPGPSVMTRPYPTMQHPLPAPSHQLYPNFTPMSATAGSEEITRDLRMTHPEVEDDYNGNLWARDDTQQGEVRMVEWNQPQERRERWVGPVL